jgi:acetyltransferase-like isoleucine patch superfamily enzyme
MKFKKAIWWVRLLLETPFWGRVGQKSYVGRPAHLSGIKRVHMGDKVRIYPGARLECGPNGRIIFGDNISIGPNVNITAFGEVRIGSGTTISANVFITDMDHDISQPGRSVMDCPNIIKITVVGENCFIGTNSVLLAGCTLDTGVVVGANSTVRGSFGANEIIVGSPARSKGQRG